MIGAGSATRARLQSRRILVVEDEYMIAEEVTKTLSNAGADVLGPFSRVVDAMQVIADDDHISAALLDVNLGQEAVWPLVDALLARGIPMVLATGYDVSAIPPAYARLPHCEKPMTGNDLTNALARVLP